jgi:predicted GIY-YIG superfamily endonuclease
MYHVYVLYCNEHRKAAIGYSKDLASLLATYHSRPLKGQIMSKRSWVLLHVERFETKKSACSRENELKSCQGREFINHLIKRKFG